MASDIDGTLLGSSRVVSKENRDAIEWFCSEGGRFTVATGRSLPGFESTRRTVAYNAPCILSNGGVLYDYEADAPIFVHPLAGRYRELILDAQRRFPGIGTEIHKLRTKHYSNPNEFIAGHFAYVNSEGTEFKNLDEVPEPWIKILFVDSPAILTDAAYELISAWGEEFQFLFSAPTMLEVQNFGTDKGTGVAKLAELLGIEEKHTYTAGDEQNDLMMLRRFESFAPANATPEAKSAANHLMPHCEEHMIAHVINFLAERYK